MLTSVHEGLDRYLPESSDKGRVLGESAALFQLSSASLKNVAYAFFEDGFSPVGMLASRVTFLESGVMCLVSTAMNVFFAVAYTGLVIATLGISFSLRTRCKLHWMHVAYGGVASAISACGVLSPYYGIGLNGYLFYYELQSFKQSYQKDISRKERHLVTYVQREMNKHRHFVYSFLKAKTDDWKYENKVRPSLEIIESRIDSAARMEDLTNLASDIFYQWPEVKAKHKPRI
jgi:hypothetical protein